jgi:hypothetical protein
MLPIMPATAPSATEANSSSANGAHCLGGVSARLKLAVIELRLHQDEFVLAAEIGEFPAEQPRPRQRPRMAGDRVGHCLVKPAQCG